jgi:hypothetical protein
MDTNVTAIAMEVGAVVAFKPAASQSLADIPARVTHVLARLANGEYLVTLEYAQPVLIRSERATRVDAVSSSLYRASA